jgi:hypothetical protein
MLVLSIGLWTRFDRWKFSFNSNPETTPDSVKTVESSTHELLTFSFNVFDFLPVVIQARPVRVVG